jgi:hypothetical protein
VCLVRCTLLREALTRKTADVICVLYQSLCSPAAVCKFPLVTCALAAGAPTSVASRGEDGDTNLSPGTSRLAVGPTQPLIQRGWSGRSVKLTTHLHIQPRLRMSGAVPPLPPYLLGLHRVKLPLSVQLRCNTTQFHDDCCDFRLPPLFRGSMFWDVS